MGMAGHQTPLQTWRFRHRNSALKAWIRTRRGGETEPVATYVTVVIAVTLHVDVPFPSVGDTPRATPERQVGSDILGLVRPDTRAGRPAPPPGISQLQTAECSG